MADELKAVVKITADTKGLVEGVDGAMRKLDSVAKHTGMLAGMEGAEKLLGLAEKVWDGISSRSEALGQMAHQFSPEAMTSQANLSIAQMQAAQTVGTAIGPYQAAIDQMKANSATEGAAQTASKSESIGQGMIVVEALKNTAEEAFSGITDGVLSALGGDAMNIASLGTASAFERTGATDMIADKLEPIVGWLDEIAGKIGGD
jgi:hypothetical protein